MDEKLTKVQSVNTELKGVIKYDPYFIDNSGTVRCVACHTEQSLESIGKTKTVKSVDGDPMTVHACPGCKFTMGVNLSLKKRISEMRKRLDLHEFPPGDKFRNSYTIPQEDYVFIEPRTETAVRLKDHEIQAAIFELDSAGTPAANDPANIAKPPESLEVPPTVEEPLPEATNESPTTDEIADVVEGESVDVIDNTLSHQFTISTDTIGEEGEEVDMSDEKGDISATNGSEANASDFFEDDEDLSHLFGKTSDQEEEAAESTDNTDTSVRDEVQGGAEEVVNTGIFGDTDDSLDDFFANIPGATPETSSDDQIREGNFEQSPSYSGLSDVKTEIDPTIESMLKNNLETGEEDIFRLDKRDESGIGKIVHRSRITDLHENYADSNAKVVVDRICKLFKTRANRVIKTNVTIDDRTHECPVVDIEGNIRLIFVDLDVPGGRYDLQREVNNKLRAPFENTSEFDLMTFVIFSDMIEDRYINRVVKAISKNIAYNLKILGVFNPISIVQESDRYFYTSSENDKDTIARFSSENCAGNVDKPHNGEVAIISQWNNPELDDTWRYRKEIQNRSVIASGGEIEYDDLSMYMTASMKYIMLPQNPNNMVINVTIVEYIESLDLFVRDGFGVLVGVLLHNIKTQYPQSKIHLYFEMDVSMIPSPTLSRYVKSGSVRPIQVNEDFVQLNKIAAIAANQNGTKVPAVYVEGEPFDSPEYQAPVWKSYMLSPEFRRNPVDGKRSDWRRFGRKSFAKTLGERFKDYRNVDVNDRKARAALLEKLGFHTVVQPQVVKTRVTDEFGIAALTKVMQTCSGMFSIAQYTRSNRSQVVSDNYMSNGGAPVYNPALGGYVTPEQLQMYHQQQAAMQQQMAYQNMMGGYFNR